MRYFYALVLILALQSACFAETTFGGYVKFDDRVYTDDSGAIAWNKATFDLNLTSKLGDNASAYGEMRLRTLDSSIVSNGTEVSNSNFTNPYEFQLREAYIDYYGFVFGNVDVRAGKQRIAWGTADKLNPTDNLNPCDFSDILEFGERTPTNAIKIDAYFDEATLQVVGIPTFTPAIMPSFYESLMVDPLKEVLSGAGIDLRLTDNVILPGSKIDNSMYGIKLKRNIAGFDTSVSFFRGYDNVPDISRILVTLEGTSTAIATAEQTFPRVDVVGFDIAGDIYGVGVWAEVAHFQPYGAKEDIFVSVPALALSLAATQEVVDYTKYTLGFDYKFSNGIYTNVQFMHGFFDEKGVSVTNFIHSLDPTLYPLARLSDILIVSMDQKFGEDKWQWAFVVGGDFNFMQDKKLVGGIVNPELRYFPADATEVSLGLFTFDGDTGTKFGMLKNQDQAYIKFKYSF